MEKINLNIRRNDFAKHLLSNNVEFYISFDQMPILNEVNANTVTSLGAAPSFMVRGTHSFAAKLLPNSKFAIPMNFANTAEFSLCFWLTSSNIKPVLNIVNNEKVFYRMSLFDKGSFIYDATSDTVSFTNGSFVIFEECRDDNKNVLMVFLFSSSGQIVLIETPPYTTNVANHFWIAYNGRNRSLVILINGKKVVNKTIFGQQIPNSIFNDPLMPFNINNSAIGNKNLLRNNSCILDDLCFVNRFIIDDNIISKVVNYSATHIVSDEYRYVYSTHKIFNYNDPSAIRLSAVINNGKNVYVGKSDGSIYKGESLIWQSKLDFASEDDALRATESVTRSSADARVEYTGDSLLLYKSDLRF